MQTARLGVGQEQTTLGAGHADIAEAALFLELGRVLGAALVGKQPLLHAHKKYQRKLEPFGAVQGHEVHALLPLLGLHFAGLECCVGKKGHQRILIRLSLFGLFLDEVAGGRHQLMKVLDAGLRPIDLVALVVGEQSAALDNDAGALLQRQPGSLIGNIVDQGYESRHGSGRSRRQHLLVNQSRGRSPQGFPLGACGSAQRIQGARTDAAGGHIDDALEGAVIIAIGEQTQVSERVPDLGTLVKAQASVHAIGHRRREKRLLQSPRLGADAIQNRHAVTGLAAVDPLLDTADHETRLVELVEGRIKMYGIAVAIVGPEVLSQAALVVGDERVRGGQDIAAGTIILLETDGPGLRKVFG